MGRDCAVVGHLPGDGDVLESLEALHNSVKIPKIMRSST